MGYITESTAAPENQNIVTNKRADGPVRAEVEFNARLRRPQRLGREKEQLRFAMSLNFNQQIKTAASYSLDAWIPFEENHYRAVREGLGKGQFSSGTELFQELVKDPALYFHCLRRLIDFAQQEPDRLEDEIDPVAIFDQGEALEKVREILASAPGLITPHRLAESGDIQARTITGSLISANVAAAFAKHEGVDPRLAHAAALFRQLGLLLIAFNYPHVYGRVMRTGDGAGGTAFDASAGIDRQLSSLLGFSPTLLGVIIARRWSISPVIRRAMGDPAAEPASPETSARTQFLENICRVGEAFARASSPDLFPSAPVDWEIAREQITSALDGSEISTLEANVRAGLEHYLSSAPQLFKIPESIALRKLNRSSPAEQDFGGNKYVIHCPLATHDKFREFYTRLAPERIEMETLDFLIQKLVVPMGFSRGCVYLLEPDTLLLVPRLAVGDARLTNFRALHYKDFSERDDKIVTAFRAAAPAAGEIHGARGKVDYIAGALGSSQRAGVLYLELSKNAQYDPNGGALVCFKALREAFNACLWLS